MPKSKGSKKKSASAETPAKGPKKSRAARRRARKKASQRTTITRVTKEVRRSNPSANPPALSDFTQVLIPGFLAYAGTKILQRIVYSIVQKKWPKLGKHAHALSGAVAFGGAWYFAHRIKQVAKYHDGIVLGSGIAAAHGIATCYLPKKYSWLLADCKPADVAAPPPANANDPTATAPAAVGRDEYSYLEDQLDEMEGGNRRAAAPAAAAPITANQNAGVDPDLMSAIDPDDDDDLYSSAFGN